MSYGPWLFLLFLFIISDTVACGFGAHTLYVHRNGMARALAWALGGIFVHGVGVLVANSFGFTVKPEFTTGFAIVFWVTRACQSLGLWYLALYMNSFKGPKKPETGG